MKRDLTNVSREGRGFVKSILSMYVKDMINDGDYVRLEKDLLDVIRAERGLALRAPRSTRQARLQDWSGRIEQWRESDKAGYDRLIELVCDLQTEMQATGAAPEPRG